MPWTEEPPITPARATSAAATWVTPASGAGSGSPSRIYVMGGNDTGNDFLATAQAYDPAHKTWSTVAAMATPRATLAAATSPATSSNPPLVHALGGRDASYTPLAAHEVYNPVTNQWSKAAPMPSARSGAAAVTGSDGLIYVIGGQDSADYVATVDAYDPVAGSWSTKPLAELPTPRMGLATAATSDGHIYAIGGANGGSAPLSTVEVYDIAANKWSTSQPVPVPIAWLAAATGPNGLIYAIAGMAAYNLNPGSAVADVHSFNPAAPALGWVRQAPLSSVRVGLAATTGPDGLVYAIGGITCPNVEISPDVEAYTYDKCDYIEYELQVAGSKLAQEEEGLAELPPAQRARAEQGLAGQRATVSNLLQQLKICRGQ